MTDEVDMPMNKKKNKTTKTKAVPLHMNLKKIRNSYKYSTHTHTHIYIYIYINSTTKENCPLGVCSWAGEYITHHTSSNRNDLDMYPATTCDCGRGL